MGSAVATPWCNIVLIRLDSTFPIPSLNQRRQALNIGWLWGICKQQYRRNTVSSVAGILVSVRGIEAGKSPRREVSKRNTNDTKECV